MRLRDLQTFKEYLKEDDGEDIVSGLRALSTAIRSNWRTPYSAVRDEQKKLWKKLSPSQQQNLTSLFKSTISNRLSNIETPINLKVFRPTTKPEANFIPVSFQVLAKGAGEVGQGMIADCQAEGFLTDSQAEMFESQFGRDKPVDPTLGPIVKKFITDHRPGLESMFGMQEEQDGLAFDVDRMRRAIMNSIKNKVAEADRVKTITGLHYVFLKMASQFNDAAIEIGNKFRGAALPETDPTLKKPAGGINPKV